MGPRYDLTKRHFVTSVRRTCFPAKMPKKRVGHEMLCCLCCPYGRISASHTLDQLSPTSWTQDLKISVDPTPKHPQRSDGLKYLHPRENLDFWGGGGFNLTDKWRVEGSLKGTPPSGGEGQAADQAAALRRRRCLRARRCAAY